jgi:hypothetical protein
MRTRLWIPMLVLSGCTAQTATTVELIDPAAARDAIVASPRVQAVITNMRAHGCAVSLDDQYLWTWRTETGAIAHGITMMECEGSHGHLATLVRQTNEGLSVTAAAVLTPNMDPEIAEDAPPPDRTLIFTDQNGVAAEAVLDDALVTSLENYAESLTALPVPEDSGSVSASLAAQTGGIFDSLFPTSTESSCREAIGVQDNGAPADLTCCGCMSDVSACTVYTGALADELLNCQKFLDCVAEEQNDPAGNPRADNWPTTEDYPSLNCSAADRAVIHGATDADNSVLGDRARVCFARVSTQAGQVLPEDFGNNPTNFAAYLRSAIQAVSGGANRLGISASSSFSGLPGVSVSVAVADTATAVLGLAASYESNMERMVSMGGLDRATNGMVGSGAQYYCWQIRGSHYNGGAAGRTSACIVPRCKADGAPTVGDPYDMCTGSTVFWAECSDPDPYLELTSADCGGRAPVYGPSVSGPFGMCCPQNMTWGVNQLYQLGPAITFRSPFSCTWHNRTTVDYFGNYCTWSPSRPNYSPDNNMFTNSGTPCMSTAP